MRDERMKLVKRALKQGLDFEGKISATQSSSLSQDASSSECNTTEMGEQKL